VSRLEKLLGRRSSASRSTSGEGDIFVIPSLIPLGDHFEDKIGRPRVASASIGDKPDLRDRIRSVGSPFAGPLGNSITDG